MAADTVGILDDSKDIVTEGSASGLRSTPILFLDIWKNDGTLEGVLAKYPENPIKSLWESRILETLATIGMYPTDRLDQQAALRRRNEAILHLFQIIHTYLPATVHIIPDLRNGRSLRTISNLQVAGVNGHDFLNLNLTNTDLASSLYIVIDATIYFPLTPDLVTGEF